MKGAKRVERNAKENRKYAYIGNTRRDNVKENKERLK